MSRPKNVVERFAEACGIEMNAWIEFRKAQEAYFAAAKVRAELAAAAFDKHGIVLTSEGPKAGDWRTSVT